jgi:hypothetical protein
MISRRRSPRSADTSNGASDGTAVRRSYKLAPPSRTIVSPVVAADLLMAGRVGQRECARWGSRSVCGPTLRTQIRVGTCAPVDLTAIVSDLPPGVAASAVAGRDLLRTVDVDSETGAIFCRVPGPGRVGEPRRLRGRGLRGRR